MGTGSLAMLPWFPANFLSSTRGWSVTAKGVYRELLDAQWELGILPADEVELRCLVGATDSEWADGWNRCGSKFKPVKGGLRNVRLEQHRSESQRLKAARVAAAERTNAKRRGDRDAERNGERSADRDAERSDSTLSDTLTATVSGTSTSTSTSTLFSSSDSGVSFGDSRPLPRAARPKKVYEERAFHDQIIAAYAELLPQLPQVKVWSKKRAQSLNARIRERLADNKEADSLAYWRRLFAEVATSDFLCGRSADFRADLEWLLRQENFAKVIEGRYANRSGANGSGTHGR